MVHLLLVQADFERQINRGNLVGEGFFEVLRRTFTQSDLNLLIIKKSVGNEHTNAKWWWGFKNGVCNAHRYETIYLCLLGWLLNLQIGNIKVWTILFSKEERSLILYFKKSTFYLLEILRNRNSFLHCTPVSVPITLNIYASYVSLCSLKTWVFFVKCVLAWKTFLCDAFAVSNIVVPSLLEKRKK